MLRVEDITVEKTSNPQIMTMTTETKNTESLKDKLSEKADSLVESAQKGVEKANETIKTKSPAIFDSLSEHKPMLKVLAAVSAFGIIYLAIKD